MQKFVKDIEELVDAGNTLKEINDAFNKTILRKGDVACPKCGHKIATADDRFECVSCDFTIFKRFMGRMFSEAEVYGLIKNNETDTLSGFSTPRGNKFRAKVRLDEYWHPVIAF